ncbi:MAG: hypothetical protein ACYDFT_00265 [Thermoplasmata archaeon]
MARLLRASRGAIEHLEKENARLAEETRHLKLEIAKTVDLSAESDVLEGGLGNRPALEAYRNVTVARFMRHVNELGQAWVAQGPAAARFKARTTVAADLAVLFACPPSTIDQAERRDRARVMLSDPALVDGLSGPGEQNSWLRESFINLVLNAGVSESTWELVQRSAESPPTA